ncbi:MAG: hypothetical protein ACREAD_08730 [Nitrosopumilaceae archaeon]
MYEISVKLGHGITKNTLPVTNHICTDEFFISAIREFGISNEALKKIKPSSEDLLEIYSELKTFGFSTKYYTSTHNLHGIF